MIKVFDGTNLHSIARSLSQCLELPPKQLLEEVKLYTLLLVPNFELGYFPLQDFLEHCKTSNIFIDVSSIQFDRVILFHKTSVIDNGVFLQEKGLLDLDKLLLTPSPLSEYLRKKGIEFIIKDSIPFVRIDEKIQPLKNLSCERVNSVKPRIVARLTKPATMNLEGITGFLFFDDARNDPTYQSINNAPEFLSDLDYCIGRGIVKEWEKMSKSVILKCDVDIESWYRPEDLREEDNKLEKSHEIMKEGFLYLVEAYAKKFGFDINFRRHDYYPFIAHGTGIPASKITELL